MTGAIAVVSICEDPNGRATAFRTTARAVHSFVYFKMCGTSLFRKGRWNSVRSQRVHNKRWNRSGEISIVSYMAITGICMSTTFRIQ